MKVWPTKMQCRMYAELQGYPGDYGESAWEYYQGMQWQTMDGQSVRSWMSVVKAHCVREASYAARQKKVQISPEATYPTENEAVVFALKNGRDADFVHEWYSFAMLCNWMDQQGRPIANWKSHLLTSIANEKKQRQKGLWPKKDITQDEESIYRLQEERTLQNAAEKRPVKALYVSVKNGDTAAAVELAANQIGPPLRTISPEEFLNAENAEEAIGIVITRPIQAELMSHVVCALERRVAGGRGSRTALIVPVPLLEFGDALIDTEYGAARTMIMRHLLNGVAERKSAPAFTAALA